MPPWSEAEAWDLPESPVCVHCQGHRNWNLTAMVHGSDTVHLLNRNGVCPTRPLFCCLLGLASQPSGQRCPRAGRASLSLRCPTCRRSLQTPSHAQECASLAV